MNSGHSRFPVIGDNPDEVVGINTLPDLAAAEHIVRPGLPEGDLNDAVLRAHVAERQRQPEGQEVVQHVHRDRGLQPPGRDRQHAGDDAEGEAVDEHRRVLRAVNWIRQKANRPPLIIPTGPGGE